MSLDLSILIINWNTRDLLVACLDSIEHHLKGGCSYEIIIVDNASTDDSVAVIKQRTEQNIILIENSENLGQARADNQAAARALGRYWLVLDSDTRLLDRGVSALIEYMDANTDVGCATGRILNDDGSFQQQMWQFPNLWIGFLRHTVRVIINANPPGFRRFLLSDVDLNAMYEPDWVCGAFMIVRASVMDGCPLFYPDIFMFYEDTLLCYEIRARGYRVVYLPIATIVHHRGASALKVPAFATYHSFRSSLIYFRRVRGAAATLVYRTSVLAAWWVFFCVFGVLRFLPDERFARKYSLFQQLLARARTGE